MTLHELAVKFEAYLLANKRASLHTVSAYRIDINQFMHFISNNSCTLDTLEISHIKDFIYYLATKQLQARTIARKISALKALFAFAEQHYDYKNIVHNVSSPKIEKKLPHYLGESDIERMLHQADQDISPFGIRNKVMIYLLYVSGMRVTELVSLKSDAIDFESNTIRIFGKGSKERIIPLPISMIALLKEYLDKTHPLLIGADTFAITILFPTLYGKKLKQLTRQAFWVIIRNLCKRAGIIHTVSPHVIRHTIATHLLHKGYNIRSLQVLLGHENISTVQIYTHVNLDHLRTIYDKKHPRS